jgi:hypothetical protein
MELTAPPKTISVMIRAAIVRVDSNGPDPLRCLNCRAPLELSQPDIDSPGRLVGVCHGCCNNCGSCHVINADDAAEAVVVMLPSFDAVKEAIAFLEASG